MTVISQVPGIGLQRNDQTRLNLQVQ